MDLIYIIVTFYTLPAAVNLQSKMFNLDNDTNARVKYF
jgi:hypothetical protein